MSDVPLGSASASLANGGLHDEKAVAIASRSAVRFAFLRVSCRSELRALELEVRFSLGIVFPGALTLDDGQREKEKIVSVLRAFFFALSLVLFSRGAQELTVSFYIYHARERSRGCVIVSRLVR